MDFIKLASERFSLRDFSDQEVEKWKIDQILKAAEIAPTAANFQSQKIYVVKTKSAIEKLKSIRPIFGARLAFIICYDDSLSWKNYNDSNNDSGPIDASIVTTHMMLAATELSVGTCWIGSFSPKKVQEIFDIEKCVHPVAILLAGYPSKSAVPSQKHMERKSFSSFTKNL